MKQALRWVALVAVVLGGILIPFALWGSSIDEWARPFTQGASGRTAAALALGGLLAADIVLPVPSSLVSTSLGYLLGIVGGTLVSFVAMTVSSLAGYGLGRFGGRGIAGRMVGQKDLERLDRLNSSWGDWFVVVNRPVPVLAEGAVLFAGIGRMSFPRFMLLSSLANLGISAVYAAVGALSSNVNSFALAFAGAMILSGVAMAIWRRKSRPKPPLALALLAGAAVALALCGESRAGELSARVQRSMAGASEVSREIEEIRGLSFNHEVAVEVESLESFRKYVRDDIEKQFGKGGATNYVSALVKLGALREPFDLAEVTVSFLETQAAAHYKPETQTCALLATNMPKRMLDMFLSHELFHALQDQQFNLQAFLFMDKVEAIRDNGDVAFARQALVEGEATLVMGLWSARREADGELSSVMDTIVSAAINAQAGMDFDVLLAASERQWDQMGPDGAKMAEASKQVAKLPRFLVESLFSAYIQGAGMVNAVRAQQGWKGIDELYRKPPTSSEQVLHPRKLLSAIRDDPVDVRLPDLLKRLPKGWALMEEDVLGELGVRIFLDVWQPPDARDRAATRSAAEGWGGDRYYYFENPDARQDLLVWETTWDTDDDASEFAVAYRATLPVRFPSLKKAGRSEAGGEFAHQTWEVSPGRLLRLARGGKVIRITDATSPPAILDAILK